MKVRYQFLCGGCIVLMRSRSKLDMARFQVSYNLEQVSGFEEYMSAQYKKAEGRQSLSLNRKSR